MTMCRITDLLFDGSLLDQLFSIVPLLLCISNTGVIIVCCWIHKSSLGDKVHTIPELQLPLQTFFDTINLFYLLARSFFTPRHATDWWNDIPITSVSSSATKFSRELYNYLLYT